MRLARTVTNKRNGLLAFFFTAEAEGDEGEDLLGERILTGLVKSSNLENKRFLFKKIQKRLLQQE